MLKKFGNSFSLIQRVQIRLEHISKHFYQKMPSQITFSGFPASLYIMLFQLAQWQIYHQTTCKVDCQPGDYRRPLLSLPGFFCMG